MSENSHVIYLKTALATLRVSASTAGDIDGIMGNLCPEESLAIRTEIDDLRADLLAARNAVEAANQQRGAARDELARVKAERDATLNYAAHLYAALHELVGATAELVMPGTGGAYMLYVAEDVLRTSAEHTAAAAFLNKEQQQAETALRKRVEALAFPAPAPLPAEYDDTTYAE